MGGSNQQHSPVTLELYVRSLSPAGARKHQERTFERLAQLEDEEAIAEYEVHVWGEQLCPSAVTMETDAGQFIRGRVSAFTEWARENDVSFVSGFDVRERESEFTGEEHTTISLPMMTLAEFRDDDLVSVAPGRSGESMYTIADRLDALAEGMDGTIEIDDDSFQRATAVSPTTGDQPLQYGGQQ